MNKHLDISIKAAIEAGEKILEIYKKDFKIFEKEDTSPLTEADQASNEIIQSYLNTTKFPIISEENKEVDFNIRREWNACWMVDPLDGTKEFIKRNDEFTVNIALIRDKVPTLGVIYVPVTRELFFADVEQKYSKKLIVPKGEISNVNFDDAIELGQITSEQELVRIVGSRSHMSTETLEYVKKVEEESGKKVEIVSKGSSLKFCLVAEGLADVYPRFAPTMEWDTAAGQAICNAIGINVINDESKQSLLYNKENLLNPWFLVIK